MICYLLNLFCVTKNVIYFLIPIKLFYRHHALHSHCRSEPNACIGIQGENASFGRGANQRQFFTMSCVLQCVIKVIIFILLIRYDPQVRFLKHSPLIA